MIFSGRGISRDGLQPGKGIFDERLLFAQVCSRALCSNVFPGYRFDIAIGRAYYREPAREKEGRDSTGRPTGYRRLMNFIWFVANAEWVAITTDTRRVGNLIGLNYCRALPEWRR